VELVRDGIHLGNQSEGSFVVGCRPGWLVLAGGGWLVCWLVCWVVLGGGGWWWLVIQQAPLQPAAGC
jgi:hypothetical protein